ncbi:MAG: hypothetical protein VXY90_11855, partial [Pseudomonadota bacterium]|nr:hypothetical protein [Pseudomonadota bacterium]
MRHDRIVENGDWDIGGGHSSSNMPSTSSIFALREAVRECWPLDKASCIRSKEKSISTVTSVKELLAITLNACSVSCAALAH